MGIRFLLTVTVFLAAGCSPRAAATPEATFEAEPLPVAPAYYVSVAWVDDDTLVLGWNPPPLDDGRNQGQRLVTLDLTDSTHVELPHQVSNAGCDFIEESSPVRLADGRIGFLRHCTKYDAPTAPTDIMAIDVDTGQQELLVELGDPWVAEGWRAGISSFSFRAGTSDGAVGFGSRICDGIGRFGVSGVAPFDFALADPAGANLADMWSLACADAVNAREPTWSPDGRRLAVFISPEARGHGDWDRMDAPYDLDLLDVGAGTLTRLASGLNDGLRIAWSPDGSTVAVVTGTEEVLRTDTWLIPSAGGRLERLVLEDGGAISELAWSPDGARLVALIDRSDWESLTFQYQPVLIRLTG